MPDKLLVSADAAAEMLSMSRSFFYQQISTGRIPAPIKISKKSLWPVKTLREFVQAEIEKSSRGIKNG